MQGSTSHAQLAQALSAGAAVLACWRNLPDGAPRMDAYENLLSLEQASFLLSPHIFSRRKGGISRV